ncbi:PRP38 family-domain-containing protein [Absidia repens]|uniref:Pre-mRNA-splicing factor 38 n=1 Tax=Absidia repens TaxID=90262 RepID=A0A1X2IUF9_9FUNG|nr:PRP38 family-domain-containing protein [Absidia repens]
MNASNSLETWGNAETMNMNPIIYQNILESRYFQGLYEKTTYHEVINEVYNQVTNIAPFVTGTTPSTAFCCLYKLWTMRLTVKQLENMIDHKDSPYIRAVGFLYLRYVCAPAQLWDWLGYYLDEEQEVNVASGPKPQLMTIGELCRMLLTEQKYYGTMLPRIPVPIARDLEQKLADYDREKARDIKTKRNDDDEDGDYRHSRRRSRSYSSRRSRSRSSSPPRRRRRSRSRSPSYRHRHDNRRRDERRELDDYERQSRRYDDRSSSRRRNDRTERDDLDDYDRKQRHRHYRSRSRDKRRSRYSDDSSDDDSSRRRRRRRSPSVTRERSTEYAGNRSTDSRN